MLCFKFMELQLDLLVDIIYMRYKMVNQKIIFTPNCIKRKNNILACV